MDEEEDDECMTCGTGDGLFPFLRHNIQTNQDDNYSKAGQHLRMSMNLEQFVSVSNTIPSTIPKTIVVTPGEEDSVVTNSDWSVTTSGSASNERGLPKSAPCPWLPHNVNATENPVENIGNLDPVSTVKDGDIKRLLGKELNSEQGSIGVVHEVVERRRSPRRHESTLRLDQSNPFPRPADYKKRGHGKNQGNAMKNGSRRTVRKPKIGDRFRMLEKITDLFGVIGPSWSHGKVSTMPIKLPDGEGYVFDLSLDHGKKSQVEYPGKGVERLLKGKKMRKYYVKPYNENHVQEERKWIDYDRNPRELFVGDLVDCRYQEGSTNNAFYRGRIAAVDNESKTCDVAYDDGEYEYCIPLFKKHIVLVERANIDVPLIESVMKDRYPMLRKPNKATSDNHFRMRRSGTVDNKARINAAETLYRMRHSDQKLMFRTTKELFAFIKEQCQDNLKIVPWPNPPPNVLQSMPLLVFEQTSPLFASRKPKGNVTIQGPLHEDRVKHVEALHIVEPSYQQVYLVRKLGQTPHYHVGSDEICTYEDKVKMLFPSDPAVVHKYGRCQSRQDGDFLKVINYGTAAFRSIQGIFSQLDFENVANEIMAGKSSDSRGNLQVSVGYVGGQSYVVDNKSQVEGPVLKVSTSPEWAKRLKILTQLVDKLSPEALFADEKRNKQFAFKIAEASNDPDGCQNRLEGGTGAISDCDHMVNCHLDTNNDDDTPGYEYVICASKMIYLDDHFVRVAILGYSRRSCLLYFERMKRQIQFSKILRRWMHDHTIPDICDQMLHSNQIELIRKKPTSLAKYLSRTLHKDVKVIERILLRYKHWEMEGSQRPSKKMTRKSNVATMKVVKIEEPRLQMCSTVHIKQESKDQATTI